MQNSMPIRAKPFDHQIEAYDFACRLFSASEDGGVPISRGVAFLMEMGTGKSLTAIGVISRLFLLNKVRRALIVAPLSIVSVWQSEFEKFCAVNYSLAVLDGALAKKADTLRHLNSGSVLNVAVVNYESAWRLEKEIISWLNGAGEGNTAVVCDEGHKIKSYRSNASKSMWKIGAAAGYRLLLTGTPICTL